MAFGGYWKSKTPKSSVRCDRFCAGPIARTDSWYVATEPRWIDVHADDLNARFKELMGDDYSVKDLRTWHGTVLAAEAFVDADPPVAKSVIKRVESAVVKEVAEALGNTPAVARSAYVDPRVVAGYERDLTIVAATKRAARCRDVDERQAILDKATRTLIQRVAKA